ncbi:ATP-binding cassette ATPase Uup [Paraferrimonas sedimenticola]|uniref:ATP-binding protein Uup n=1 Tax=Paraferrimonas sedimenticola TaxID=375674 RepID=A0AA37RV59_9GAMM|nr:ABC transporter ATP-binding protein [Paraferrimonas sedimenticola]GLP96006.1 ABC transporter ATPase [Paraferrimonas sedimenticola]
MNLVRLNQACLAFGHTPLLADVDLVIEEGERVCIVGRNGAGKSSLMKVLDGSIDLDDGEITVSNDVTLARLQQDPPQSSELSVYDYIAQGLADVGNKLAEFQRLSQDPDLADSPEKLAKLTRLQEQVDQGDGWQFDSRIQSICQRLKLNPAQSLQELSGGWLRKVALAQTLVLEPDLLMLDEPTNHLDIDTIEWLEQLLLNFKGAIVFISHDRGFIDRLATRIIDLDRGVATSWPGSYQEYLEGKQKWLAVEAEHNAQFDKKLAEEETWIRQGIKARRTRNEGRVRALKAMREQRSERLKSQGQAKLSVDDTSRSGKRVFEVDNISFNYDGEPLVKNFSTQVMRGDRIAIVGPNGCGKSTLIKCLIGQLEPSQGEVKRGTKLEIAYFDQYRQQLDENKTVEDNVGEGKQHVMVNGRDRHILSYLQDFLFSPERARTPVKALSGGEKNRLLLARLLLKPANLIILDEPTNDLDIETLELLESMLVEFAGTLLIVSHDRAFIDNTVTSSWWFAGEGQWHEYVGGYQDAVSQGANFYRAPSEAEANVSKPKHEPAATKPAKSSGTKKLSYKLQRELEALPEQMEQLEVNIEDLQQAIAKPEFFEQEQQQVNETLAQLAEYEQQLETLFERWEELEQLKQHP